ncbi:nucleoside deaminase [Dyadobacter sp. 3J3]|uniref:nucleoside deaminase n=1 Tax=Dyadobacter sp. 3J3 TaxID=2606600 RepID=UPI00135A193C|nr:nucleoside deaminase [Dyadobacter sp. 3J3]
MISSKEPDYPKHEYFLRRCIELALIAKNNGESPVGSLIVKNGEIIGEGIEAGRSHLDITFHAEIEAIRNASRFLKSQDLSDCILYTTHEPCMMCSYVIRHTKIKMIVMGLTTGELGGFSADDPLLLKTVLKWANPPVIVHGILKDACENLHRE